MQILNIFNTGGLTLGVSLVYVALQVIFWVQIIKNSKLKGVKWYKSPFLIYSAVILGLYILALISIGSDYKGV
jgi:hypothetical protein